jgi:hypothetical protein
VQTNIAGDTKTITYDINEALENGGSGLNGLKAVAPTAGLRAYSAKQQWLHFF